MISHVVVIDVYIAELMVEGNVTLKAQTVLSVLKTTSDVQVTDSNGASHTVTLKHNELVAGIIPEHFLLSLAIIPNSYFNVKQTNISVVKRVHLFISKPGSSPPAIVKDRY